MAWEYKPYQESDDVLRLRQQYEAYQQNKPQDYSNQYASQITGLQNQIGNRKAFSYDVNSDALYQQMAQRYQQMGKQAMQDTMGKAAGLTGGYGSSYGQAVGQQQYNAYLQGIADNLPEYYNMALNAYQQEGADLQNKLNMYQTAEAQDYGRWQDRYNMYNTELNRLNNAYNTERSWDRNIYDTDNTFNRSVYENDRNFDYTKQQNDMQLAQTQVNWYLSNGMMPPDDLIAMSGLSPQYIADVQARQAAAMAAASSGSGVGVSKKPTSGSAATPIGAASLMIADGSAKAVKSNGGIDQIKQTGVVSQDAAASPGVASSIWEALLKTKEISEEITRGKK